MRIAATKVIVAIALAGAGADFALAQGQGRGGQERVWIVDVPFTCQVDRLGKLSVSRATPNRQFEVEAPPIVRDVGYRCRFWSCERWYKAQSFTMLCDGGRVPWVNFIAAAASQQSALEGQVALFDRQLFIADQRNEDWPNFLLYCDQRKDPLGQQTISPQFTDAQTRDFCFRTAKNRLQRIALAQDFAPSQFASASFRQVSTAEVSVSRSAQPEQRPAAQANAPPPQQALTPPATKSAPPAAPSKTAAVKSTTPDGNAAVDDTKWSELGRFTTAIAFGLVTATIVMAVPWLYRRVRRGVADGGRRRGHDKRGASDNVVPLQMTNGQAGGPNGYATATPPARQEPDVIDAARTAYAKHLPDSSPRRSHGLAERIKQSEPSPPLRQQSAIATSSSAQGASNNGRASDDDARAGRDPRDASAGQQGGARQMPSSDPVSRETPPPDAATQAATPSDATAVHRHYTDIDDADQLFAMKEALERLWLNAPGDPRSSSHRNALKIAGGLMHGARQLR